MGTSDRIERERLAKRTLILEAARELFSERGYEAVTLREVAQRIEHSTTAVYVHFKDKRHLVEQMVAEDFAQFAAALEAEAAVRPAMLRLQRLGRAYVNFALTLPRHYQLLFLTPPPSKTPPEATPADPAGVGGYSLLLSTIEECIAEGSLRPELRDACGLAQAVWSAVHGLVSLLIVMGHETYFEWRPADELFELSLGAMLRGMARDPESVNRMMARAHPSTPRTAVAPVAAPASRSAAEPVAADKPAAAAGKTVASRAPRAAGPAARRGGRDAGGGAGGRRAAGARDRK
jgi:AcrR family transcriptional regulator